MNSGLLPLTGANLLGGIDSAEGDRFFADRPSPDEIQPGFAGFAAATPEEVAAAVAVAEAAFDHMHSEGPIARGARLRSIAEGLLAHRGQIVQLADAETALGRPRLDGEFDRTVGQLTTYAAAVEAGNDLETVLSPADDATGRPQILRTTLPIGPVAVFGAGNFPLAFGALGTDTASALAAGCPVVVKAHPSHPATNELCVRAALAALAHSGTQTAISLLHGGADVGAALAGAGGLQAVAFTGSKIGGRALMDVAARRNDPIPVFAEMGSVNPVVISPTAAAVRGRELGIALATAIMGSAGQLCTKPGFVFVPDSRSGDALVADLADRLAAAPALNLLDARVGERLTERLHELTSLARVRVHTGGTAETATLMEWDGGPDDDRRLIDEVFGPTSVVARYRQLSDIAPWVPALEGQLTWTIHGEESEYSEIAVLASAAARHAGRIVWNGMPTGVAVVDAMHHGGPWPATSTALGSVGPEAIRRFRRPISLQGVPETLLAKIVPR